MDAKILAGALDPNGNRIPVDVQVRALTAVAFPWQQVVASIASVVLPALLRWLVDALATKAQPVSEQQRNPPT